MDIIMFQNQSPADKVCTSVDQCWMCAIWQMCREQTLIKTVLLSEHQMKSH